MYDVAIIGAGPAGLSLACMLDAQGLKVAVVERQAQTVLENPPYDGRDIALTHRSIDIMRSIGVLDRIDGALDAPIRHARVLNGVSPYSLHFENGDGSASGVLGYLVPNNVIRRATYDAFKTLKNVTLLTDVSVTNVHTTDTSGTLELSGGKEKTLEARLIVAADSRFSETRRKMGISARMNDFGRVCIVFRMGHSQDHDETAYECFQYDQTLAVLPVTAREASVVLTLASDRADQVMKMPEADFNADITRRFDARFGDMHLVGTKHAYPLVAVYADRFYARRFAVVGDAAVGMHPVTAHGFNFGLMSADTLSQEIAAACKRGLDFGAQIVLARYSRAHQRATRPLYLATNGLVKLYTDDRRPARMARDVLLRLGNIMAPVRRAITGRLIRVPLHADETRVRTQ